MVEVRIGAFSGLNTTSLPVDVGFKGLVDVVNMIPDSQGHYSTRPGYASAFAGRVDAAFSQDGLFLFLSGGWLWRGTQAGTVEAIGPLAGNRLVCAKVGADVHIHTDQAQAVLSGSQLRPLGVPLPRGMDVVVGRGSLPAGQYLVTATEVDEAGRESGALPVQAVTVPDGASLNVFLSLTPGRIGNVYVSGQNGKECYFFGAAQAASIRTTADTLNLKMPCLRHSLGAFPTADFMAWHDGYVWVAQGSKLYRSAPLDYEARDLLAGFDFGSPIRMLANVGSGLFVSNGEMVYWISAGRPDEYRAVKDHFEPAIAGSSRLVLMERMGPNGGNGVGVLFATRSGICLGAPDGSISQLTRRAVAFAGGSHATAMHYNRIYVVRVSK